MGSSYDPTSLAPVITFPTQAPFPKITFVKEDGSDEAVPRTISDDKEKVHVHLCSEFLQHVLPATAFQASRQLGFVLDAAGQPMVVSIGADKRLYLLYHVDGGRGGWQLMDVTPASAEFGVAVFGLASFGGKMCISAALPLATGGHSLHCCHIDQPSFHYNEEKRTIEPQPSTLFKWRQISNNLGAKTISTLTCTPAAQPSTISSSFQINVGTAESQSTASGRYVVDPSAEAKAPWKYFALPDVSHRVMQVEGANTRAGVGLFTLYDRGGSTGCTQMVVVPGAANASSSTTNLRLLTSDIGNARAMAANTNPELKTDLFIAGEAGIGFYDAHEVTKPPQVIMPTLSFQQVECSEGLDPDNSGRSIISLFALDDDNELYHFTGTRNFTNNRVTFETSGLPIKANVARLSCMYNSTTGAKEFVYAHTDDQNLQLMVQDASGSVWSQSTIMVPGTGKTTMVPTYSTLITCTDSQGNPVPEGYTIDVGCDAFVYVTANGAARRLGPMPTPIATDDAGKVAIRMAADATLLAPNLRVSVSQGLSKPQRIVTSPASRVVRALSTFRTRDDLVGARDAQGRPALPGNLLQTPGGRSALDANARLLGHFTDLVRAADPDVGAQVFGGPRGVGDLTLSLSKDESGAWNTHGDTWIEGAYKTARRWASDVLEWVKSKVKSVLKLGFRIVAGVLEFAVDVLGKVVRIVVSGVGPLLRTVVNFLRDSLGIDLTGLLNWLGFVFDVNRIKETQKVLVDGFSAATGLSTRFLATNRAAMVGILETLRGDVRRVVKDTRPAEPSTAPPGLMSDIMHNPVVDALMLVNPFKILLDLVVDAATESAGEAFHNMFDLSALSNLGDLLLNAVAGLGDAVDKEIATLWRYMKDLQQKLNKAFRGDTLTAVFAVMDLVKDFFWTVLDCSAILAMAAYDLLAAIFADAIKVFSSTIKVPLLTTVFEVVAEQDFSLLNCATFIGAGVLNLTFAVAKGKLPFDVMPKPDVVLRQATDADLSFQVLMDKTSGIGLKHSTGISLSAYTANEKRDDPANSGSDDEKETDQNYQDAKAFYGEFMKVPSTLMTCVTGIGGGLAVFNKQMEPRAGTIMFAVLGLTTTVLDMVGVGIAARRSPRLGRELVTSAKVAGFSVSVFASTFVPAALVLMSFRPRITDNGSSGSPGFLLIAAGAAGAGDAVFQATNLGTQSGLGVVTASFRIAGDASTLVACVTESFKAVRVSRICATSGALCPLIAAFMDLGSSMNSL